MNFYSMDEQYVILYLAWYEKSESFFSFLLFYKMCLFSLRLLAEVVLEKTTKISRISSFSAKQFCPQRQIDREAAPEEYISNIEWALSCDYDEIAS